MEYCGVGKLVAENSKEKNSCCETDLNIHSLALSQTESIFDALQRKKNTNTKIEFEQTENRKTRNQNIRIPLDDYLWGDPFGTSVSCGAQSHRLQREQQPRNDSHPNWVPPLALTNL